MARDDSALSKEAHRFPEGQAVPCSEVQSCLPQRKGSAWTFQRPSHVLECASKGLDELSKV